MSSSGSTTIDRGQPRSSRDLVGGDSSAGTTDAPAVNTPEGRSEQVATTATSGPRSAVEPGRRFIVCRGACGSTGPEFQGLSRGFASFEQALAACPAIAQDAGVDLDDVVIAEVHEFWECF